ncbi:MAG: hypothetical protein LBK04_00405 [Clostridiales Family XIII bacterium]|jgi:hypothetical protein|nr:hypothetical protein [Clostridiales Family XIII bacterium]
MSLYDTEKKNYVFIGEAGCGKTELSVNLAREIAKANTGAKTVLIDMDQTKGDYRSRDFGDALSKYGVRTVSGPSTSDAPVVPPNVLVDLADKDSFCVMDVGGNKAGAVMVGQFSDRINEGDCAVFFPVNPYRSFSNSRENILRTLGQLKTVGNIHTARLICNPNFGRETTKEDVLEGYRKTVDMLEGAGQSIDILVVPGWIEITENEAARHGLPEIHIIDPVIEYI